MSPANSQDHLVLETLLLAVASGASCHTPIEILDGLTLSPRPGTSDPGTSR